MQKKLSLDRLHKKKIELEQFNKEYDKFMNETKEFRNIRNEKHPGAITSNQKDILDYIDGLNLIYNDFNSKKGKGLKTLTKQQMLSRLPILLAQIQAGNNSNKLKNELRQLIYYLYRSKTLTKTVYNNLIKII